MLYIPAPIEEAPEVVLSQWTVYQLPDGDHHFVGYNLLEGAGRVSSKIVAFNKDTMIGTTRSGRIYKLQGEPGTSMQAVYVWNAWLNFNDIAGPLCTDVSDQYFVEQEDSE